MCIIGRGLFCRVVESKVRDMGGVCVRESDSVIYEWYVCERDMCESEGVCVREMVCVGV